MQDCCGAILSVFKNVFELVTSLKNCIMYSGVFYEETKYYFFHVKQINRIKFKEL